MTQDKRGRAPLWHAMSVSAVLDRLDADRETGLNSAEAERRRAEHGPNRLQEAETRPWWQLLVDQFKTIVVYLLASAAVIALASGRWPEGLAVVAVILVNAAIGFVSEWKAMRSMAALRELGEQHCRVRREAEEREIPASQIVPGDLVLLASGELVPADLRLVRAERLRVNEAALTGESVPAGKQVDELDGECDLAERRNMLYKGTSVADGEAVGVVVATGSATELGRIAELAESAEGGDTPLQQRLDRLGHTLAWITVVIAVAVAGLGLLVRRQEAALVVETALALGIAAIPEGLPVVATIALARGMVLMARRRALVNRLTAVETLGATRVIFTDKTGTLTENRMRLARIVTADGTIEPDSGSSRATELDPSPGRRALQMAVCCTTAELGREQHEDDPKGDPTELALLEAGRDLGIATDCESLRVESFDPRVKMMATYHEIPDEQGVAVAVKGAPDAVLEICHSVLDASGTEHDLDREGRGLWLQRSRDLAAEGLRVLAVAEKRVPSSATEPYEALCFLGLLGLLDPPRSGVKDAIDTCQAAGIRVEMVTGDQPSTAESIAAEVGIIGDPEDPDSKVMRGRELAPPEELGEDRAREIDEANIFARVSPEQKLNLVAAAQARGEIVAMTGDGVNDAPALKKADIGVAMGRRGTEAAKQVADMVLEDDAFETIVMAVEQGRIIFANIRRSVMFMLCTNVAEVMAVTVATLAAWTLPIKALQILYLNVLTDVFPALALGVGRGSGSEMSEPPRDPREAVVTRRHWVEIAAWATLLAGCVLAGLLLAEKWLGLHERQAVTVSFLTLAFAKLWFSFNLRSPRSGFVNNEITRNPWLWLALVLCSVLLVAAVRVPLFSELLDTSAPGLAGWLLLLGMSLVPLVVGQMVRWFQGIRWRRSGESTQQR